MTLRELKERRAQIVSEMRSLNDSPAGEGGDLSAEQAEKFDTLRKEQENLESRIARQEALDDAERRMQGQPVGTGDHDFDRARRDFNLTRAIAGAAGLAVDDAREREVMQEIRNRSGNAFRGIPVPAEVFEERVLTSGGDGGDLVATDHLGGQFIDRLREAVQVRRLGARVLRGLRGNVEVPKLTDSGTVAWVGENGALTSADHTFGQVGLSPKHAGALTELSRNMLLQSSPDIEQLVRRDFAQILAAALDRVAIEGGGSDEPTGILADSNVTSVDMSSGVTWSNIQDLIGTVEDEDSEGTAFLTSPKVVRGLRTTNKVDGEPEHGFLAESRNSLDGYNLARSTLVPVASGTPDSSSLIFGRWSDMLIGFWSEIDILVNPFETTAYSKGNVQVRAMMTADVALRHEESFAYGADIEV